MRLSGYEFKQLHAAISNAFPTDSSLAQMVRFGLNKHLEEIAGGENLATKTFNLIRWAESTNNINQLLSSAIDSNPQNADLIDCHTCIASSSAVSENLDTPDCIVPDAIFRQATSAHLNGDIWLAYELYSQVKEIAPHYPEISRTLQMVQLELNAPYTSSHGKISEPYLLNQASQGVSSKPFWTFASSQFGVGLFNLYEMHGRDVPRFSVITIGLVISVCLFIGFILYVYRTDKGQAYLQERVVIAILRLLSAFVMIQIAAFFLL